MPNQFMLTAQYEHLRLRTQPQKAEKYRLIHNVVPKNSQNEDVNLILPKTDFHKVKIYTRYKQVITCLQKP
jgi:hypothetical protein